MRDGTKSSPGVAKRPPETCVTILWRRLTLKNAMDELRAPDPARQTSSSNLERERSDMLQAVDYGPRTPNRWLPSRGHCSSGQTHYETPLRDRSPSRYQLRSASKTPPLIAVSHGARTPRRYTPSRGRYSNDQTRLDYEFETPLREQSASRYQLRSASKTPPRTLGEHPSQATRTPKSFQRSSRGTM
ncbi:hypothetical protein ON010_g4569 [Phytophthora cinnamomi]|nr:hypothetical protein ON010_g4569 [Phytophthora cinnamomi]